MISARLGIKDAARRASQIEGWMSPAELEWLASVASRRTLIVEVGSWLGRSTKALACATSGVVYAVDHWKGSADGGTQAGLRRLGGPDKVFDKFREHLQVQIRTGHCVPLRMDSATAIAEMSRRAGPKKVELVFIDGDHRYESVRRDIEAWRPLLTPGGLLCGHDYSGIWPGVVKAVNQLVPKRGVVPGTTIWWYKGPT